VSNRTDGAICCACCFMGWKRGRRVHVVDGGANNLQRPRVLVSKEQPGS
jgi:hypothetical protein